MVDVTSANNFFHTDAQLGLPPPINSTQYWLNPLNVTRSEKDALICKVQKRSQSTANPSLTLHDDHEFKPHPPQPNKKPRTSSKPLVPRDSVSPERARHLERNRIAANKCRLKKKREHEQIQNFLDNETAKRDTLLAEVDFLKEEVWHLKNRIFEHAKCDDQQINLQLAKMTQSVLDGSSSPLTLKSASPSFSVSTWSDGSVLDAGAGGSMASGDVSMTVPEDIYGGYSEAVFDSLVDAPCV